MRNVKVLMQMGEGGEGGGRGGRGGDLESIEKWDLLPTASLFCILHLLCHPTLQYISDEAQAWHNIERAMQP